MRYDDGDIVEDYNDDVPASTPAEEEVPQGVSLPTAPSTPDVVPTPETKVIPEDNDGMRFDTDIKTQIKDTSFDQKLSITDKLIKYSGGMIKDTKQANYVMIGVIAIAILVSFFLLAGNGDKETPNIDTNQGIIAPEEFIPGKI